MAPTAAATHAQLEALINFMREHAELARGLLRGADGRLRSKRLWEDLCNSLNSMGSCTKTVEQWQRVWSDRKHLAKKAAGASRRSAHATGGGPSDAPTPSQIELQIISIMGEGFGEPETPARVPAFPLRPPVREPVATSPTHAARPAEPLSQEQPSISPEALELSQLTPILQWTPSRVALANPELPTMQSEQTLNYRPARPQVRRHHGGNSSRRIVEMEEQRLVLETRRNEVLVEIKDAVVELCALVRDYVTRNT